MSTGYKAVDIQTFRSATRDIAFDVYLKLSEDNMAHVFSRTTGLDYKRLAQYIQKGVKELYIKLDDDAAYQGFIARSADTIFGGIDARKLQSSSTLFLRAAPNEPVFREVLDKYFGGLPDEATDRLLSASA